MSDATFDDVIKLLLDLGSFTTSEHKALALHQQTMEGILASSRNMNKNMAYDFEKLGTMLRAEFSTLGKQFSRTMVGMESQARVTGVTIGRALRLGASGMASMGEFRGASAMYGLERIAIMSGVANVGILNLTGNMTKLGTVAGGIGLVLAPILTMAAGAEFNQALAKMGTLLDNDGESSQTYARDLDILKNQIVAVSIKFNQDLIPTTKAFKEALSSGIKTHELAEFMDEAGKASVSMGLSLEGSAAILTSFKDAYGLTISQLKPLNDVLFSAIDVSKMKAEELRSSLGRVLPTANAAGISITDLMGALASLTRQGMTTSNAVTSLNQFISGMRGPSEKAQEVLASHGIVFGEMAFKGKTLMEVLKKLNEQVADEGDFFTKAFPEERAKRGITALAQTQHQLDLTADSITQVNSRVGIADIAAQKSMDNALDAAGRMGHAVSSTFQQIGDDMIKAAARAFGDENGFSQVSFMKIQMAVEYVGISLKAVAILIESVVALGARGFQSVYHSVMSVADALKAVYELKNLNFAAAWDTIKDGANEAALAAAQPVELLKDVARITMENGKSMVDSGNRINVLKAQIEDLKNQTAPLAITQGDLNKELKGTSGNMRDAGDAIEEFGGKIKKLSHEEKEEAKERQKIQIEIFTRMADASKLNADQIQKIVEKNQKLLELKEDIADSDKLIAQFANDETLSSAVRAEAIRKELGFRQKLLDQAKSMQVDFASQVSAIENKMHTAMTQVSAEMKKELGEFQAASTEKLDLLNTQLMAEAALLEKRAENTDMTKQQFEELSLAVKEFERDRKESEQALHDDMERNLRFMQRTENDKIEAIKRRSDIEIRELRRSLEFISLSADEQKTMIDELIAKRDEAIKREVDGYHDAVAAVRQAEKDKLEAINHTVDAALDHVKQQEQDNKPSKAEMAANHGGVSGSVSANVMGDMLTNGKGEVLVGGPKSGIPDMMSAFTANPNGDTVSAEVTKNIITNISVAGSTATSADIQKIAAEVIKVMERNKANQTGQSSYPVGR